jgi:NADPH:quinone reductase-like Zn-dependent oxidoreductase
MRAIAHDGYGPPESLELRDVNTPSIDDRFVLIRVHAASVNPLDWHLMRGEPSFMRMIGGKNPVGRIPGSDVAGVVEKVGASATQFRAGDEVFGTCRGALAEYARSNEKNLAPKPVAVTWEQAASIGVAGCTALQGLRDHGRLQPGQSVLVNGAAGGVGTFAVQLAKALGAKVTGVCSTRNLELVRSLGADDVVDYTAEDFTQVNHRYDLILQVAGNRTVADMRRALAPRGTVVVIGGGTGREDEGEGGVFELVRLMIKGQLLSRFARQRELMFMARIRRDDLTFIARLIAQRTLTPVIDRTYPLADAAEAIRHLEGGHARGKIVVTVT